MATMQEIIDNQAGLIAENFSSFATFTPAVGSPVLLLRCDLNKEIVEQPGAYDMTTWTQHTTIKCLLSDLAAEPNRGETFLISSTTYTVQGVIENDRNFVKVIVT